MELNEEEKIAEIYKKLLNGNHGILSEIVYSYASLAERFPLELSKLLFDLENKTEDVFYNKEVMQTYLSIMKDVQKLLESMNSAIENSNELQSVLNQGEEN